MNPQIKNRFTGAVIYEGESGMPTRVMLEKATAAKVDLYGADLYGADLRGADLYGVDLRGADLRDADLSRVDLSGADLSSASLSSADLSRADLFGADLSGADLSRADLSRADLSRADLFGADLGEEFGKLITGRLFFQCGPIGSRSDYLMSFATDQGLVIKTGCFMGFIDEFAAAVEKTHGDTDHGKEYAMAILMIKARAAIWSTK